MAYSDEEIEQMRRQCADYEDAASKDPDMANQLVFAMRPGNVNKDMMVALWGEDCLEKHIQKECPLCKTAIIVRPVFSKALAICMGCVPRIKQEMHNPRAIN